MSKIPTTARNAVKRRSLGHCERCFGRGTDVHHRKGGNPRRHAIPNLLRLCRTCHEWATNAPHKAAAGGWVLRGTFAAETASQAPLALLGLYWVTLDVSGGYMVGGVPFGNIRQVQQAGEVDRLSGTSAHRLTEAMRAAVTPSEEPDTGGGDAEPVSGVVRPFGTVTIPRRFRVQGGESVEDFRARLTQEFQPVDGVADRIGPLNQPR